MIQVERMFKPFSVVNYQLLFGPPVGFNFPRLKVSACVYKRELIYLLLGQEFPFSLKQTKQPGPGRVIWGKSFCFSQSVLVACSLRRGFPSRKGALHSGRKSKDASLHFLCSALSIGSDRVPSSSLEHSRSTLRS